MVGEGCDQVKYSSNTANFIKVSGSARLLCTMPVGDKFCWTSFTDRLTGGGRGQCNGVIAMVGGGPVRLVTVLERVNYVTHAI